MYHFDVEMADAGKRLDEFLHARIGQVSRMYLTRLIAGGACAVNGTIMPAGHHLKTGDAVGITLDAEAPTAMTPAAILLDILYEDDALIVVVKPHGMLVHPTRSVKSDTLLNALAYHFNHRTDDEAPPATIIRPGLVHRLDRATSGLMVIAKKQRTLSILARHFHERKVKKNYLAVVRGHPARDEMMIDAPIGRASDAWPKWQARGDGKEARTRLRVLERKDDISLVALEPITGRTNQLRIHCATIGCPIAGDEWYGGASDAYPRLCLHAAQLGFYHPAGNGWMEHNSPLPKEIIGLLS